MMISANMIIITIPAIKPAPGQTKEYLKIAVYYKFTTRPAMIEKQVNISRLPICYQCCLSVLP